MASATISLSTASSMQHKEPHPPSQASPRRLSRVSGDYAVERENDASTIRKSSQNRRTRSSRISERWPVLYKLIRAKHNSVSRPNTPVPPIESEDEDDDDEPPVVPSFTRRRLLSSQPTYPKFPSPLSGICSFNKRQGVVRHNYIHRGFSQSALHAQRELWRKRKYEWDDYEHLLWQYGMRLEEIYGGIVEPLENLYQGPKPQPPFKRTDSRCAELTSDAEKNSNLEGVSATASNPAVFPRLGDLSSIRDPFLISVDTWFSEFPLWTLSKLIWIYDLNYRSDAKKEVTYKAEELTSESDGNAVTSDVSSEYSTATISTTSDATLVPDESNHHSGSSAKDVAAPDSKNGDPASSYSSETIYASEGKKGKGWETNWFLRWETLYHQVSLAIDLAIATSVLPTQALDQSRQNKDATRIILTSPKVLYDPNADESVPMAQSLQPDDIRIETVQYQNVSIPNVILPVDDEEEDYGDVITSSRYRLGAHMDPLSMFATAHPDDYDSEDSDTVINVVDSDRASCMHRNGCEFNSLTDVVKSLTICA